MSVTHFSSYLKEILFYLKYVYEKVFVQTWVETRATQGFLRQRRKKILIKDSVDSYVRRADRRIFPRRIMLQLLITFHWAKTKRFSFF